MKNFGDDHAPGRAGRCIGGRRNGRFITSNVPTACMMVLSAIGGVSACAGATAASHTAASKTSLIIIAHRHAPR